MFGKVYQVKCKETGAVFAMKFVEVDTEKQRKYLGNELTLMKSLDHPNILKISDAIFHENTMYMFMDFMDGGALTDLVISKERKLFLTEEAIAFILYEVAKGVQYLHKNNIIHRDIKSDNILLRKEHNEVKICDFGYAC